MWTPEEKGSSFVAEEEGSSLPTDPSVSSDRVCTYTAEPRNSFKTALAYVATFTTVFSSPPLEHASFIFYHQTSDMAHIGSLQHKLTSRWAESLSSLMFPGQCKAQFCTTTLPRRLYLPQKGCSAKCEQVNNRPRPQQCHKKVSNARRRVARLSTHVLMVK